MSSAEIHMIDEAANKFNPEHTFVNLRKKSKKAKILKTDVATVETDDSTTKTTLLLSSSSVLSTLSSTVSPKTSVLHKEQTANILPTNYGLPENEGITIF